jgi:hypothetical protein
MDESLTYFLVDDYNGDGLDDLMAQETGDGNTDILKRDYSDSRWSILNLTSEGFQPHVLNCFDNFDIDPDNNRFYAKEMNGDSRTDVVVVGRGQDTGNLYTRINVATNSGNNFSLTEYISTISLEDIGRFNFRLGDFNGDSRGQLLYNSSPNGILYSFAGGTPGHLIGTLIDGMGVRTDLTYLPMSDSSVYTRGTGAIYPLSDYCSSSYLVSQVSTDNGIGGITTVNYQYAGAKVHQEGKGFLGYSLEKNTNNATGITTEKHNTFDETYYYQQLAGVYIKYGNITLSATGNTWDEISYGDQRIFPYVSSTVQTDNLRGLGVTSTAAYNSYGNPISVTNKYGSGHTQTLTYAYDDERVSDWLIGRPTTITETSVKGSDTRTFVTNRTYFTTNNSPDVDQYNTGDASYWQLDREYDSFGNLWKEHQSTTGLSARTTVYTYDSNGVNLLKVTDPVGRETGYTYEAATGMKKTETDPFGNLTTWNYNSSDQVNSIVPEGGITTTLTRNLDVTNGPANARYYVQGTGSDGSQSKTWYDKLDREIRRETKNFSGSMVKRDQQYNCISILEEPPVPGVTMETTCFHRSMPSGYSSMTIRLM